MTPTITFRPKHNQPVTLEALLELEPAIISAEITRLENSINHLIQSNADLISAEKEEDESDEREVYVVARRENEEVIASQRERISMMKLALHQLIGVGSDNPHYAVGSTTAGETGSAIREAGTEDTPSTGTHRPGPGDVEEGEVGNGVFL